MEKEKIELILREAIHELFAKDGYLLKRKLNIHERTLVHRLAIYIEKRIEEYDVDVEYNRMRSNYDDILDIADIIGKNINFPDSEPSHRYVYPDLIIHKRNQDDNLVEIEVKMKWKNREKKFDLKKINQYMIQLKYKFGIYIELAEKEEDVLIEFGPFNN